MLQARIEQLPIAELVGQHLGKDSDHRIGRFVPLTRKPKAFARLSPNLGQRRHPGLRAVLQCNQRVACAHHDRRQAEPMNRHEGPITPGSR